MAARGASMDKNNSLLLTIVAIVAIVGIAVMVSVAVGRNPGKDSSSLPAQDDSTGMAAAQYPPQTTCTDSDGGTDYYIRGTAGDRADYCRNFNSNALVEFSCDGDEVVSWDFDCYYGCSNGACLGQY